MQNESPALLEPGACQKLLFVDLDGTLIKSDLLWESLFLLARQRPADLLKLPGWLASGRAALKARLAERVMPDVATLPFREDVIDYLRQMQAEGWDLVLATASHERVAEKVCQHLGLFVGYLGTSDDINLKGSTKLRGIREFCQQRNVASFAYVGDSQADLSVWESAALAVACAPTPAVEAKLSRLGRPYRVISQRRSQSRALLRAMRPHQWAKNLLIFVPLILAHRFGDWNRWLSTCCAMAAFSACASAIYLINDALDVEHDRRHHSKRRRPLASGDLHPAWVTFAVPALCLFGFGLSLLTLPWEFAGILAIYLGANLAYSQSLKRVPLLDVVLLAGMYVIRVLAGGIAADVEVSEWLLAFSSFFFLSLAFVKRYTELDRAEVGPSENIAGRGYRPGDISLIESMGCSSGYLAVLVFALYLNSEEMRLHYTTRWPLWLLCTVLLYWISRLWLWAKRGELHEDPVTFALTDRVSLALGVVVGALLVMAGIK